jgi:hypothetical protein
MVINTNFIFTIGILLTFLSDRLVIGYIANENAETIAKKLVIGIFMVFSLYYIRIAPSYIRKWFIGLSLYFGFLTLESYYWYGVPFIYPFVFSQVSIIYTFFFIYLFYKKFGNLNINLLTFILLGALFFHIAIVAPESFSLSAFTSHERGISASTAYITLLPCLYFFNRFFFYNKQISLWLFFLTFGLIVFFQHRTVWVATLVALILNILLLLKKTDIQPRMTSILSLIGYPFIVGFIGLSFVLAEKPEVLDKIMTDVEDIQNYKTQGTGSWRYNQYKSYEPFIQDHLIAGMRFEGFELPEQFYKSSGEGEIQEFADMTGHHIHISYVNYLFYFGIIGLLLFDVPAVYFVARKVWKIPKLSFEQIVFVSCSASFVSYAFAYNIPMFMYGYTGLALYYLDKVSTKEEAEVVDEDILITSQ